MLASDDSNTFYNGRPRRAKRRKNRVSKKTFAISLILTSLIASLTGGALVSYTVQATIDRSFQSQNNPPQIINNKANTANQAANSNSAYQVPSNGIDAQTSSSDSALDQASGSQTISFGNMSGIMGNMDTSGSVQNQTINPTMNTTIPAMIRLMSDRMKGMLAQMFDNTTKGKSMGNQTMSQEMQMMLQNMDKTLTMLNSIVNESITNGNVSNETMIMMTNSINQVSTLMNQLIQLIQITTIRDTTTSPMTDVAINASNTAQNANLPKNP